MIKIIEENRERGIKLLKHLIKEISNKTLEKEFFIQVSNNLLGIIFELWIKTMQEGNLKNLNRMNKILNELIVNGFNEKLLDKYNKIFEIILIQLNLMIQKYQPENHYLDKCILSFIQIPFKFQYKQKKYFNSNLINYLKFTQQIIENPIPFNYFIVKCLTFIYNVLEKKTNDNETILLNEYFSSHISTLIHSLLNNFMKLTQQDLALWKDDPEEFFISQDLDESDFSIRGSSEQLFIILLETFGDDLIKFILKQTNQILLKNDNIFLRDSCYSALGWGCYSFYDSINFNDWYKKDLKNELKNTKSNLIKRRVIWLAGRWIEKLDREIRIDCYQSFLSILLNDNDIVLNLTILQSIESMLDEQSFQKNDFKEYTEGYLKKIIYLLNNLSSEETRLKLLHLLALMFKKLENIMLPYLNSIINLFKNLTKSNSSLMIESIIVCFTSIIEILKKDSNQIHSIILPYIIHTTDVKKQIMMFDDPLNLLNILLHYSTSISKELYIPFENLLKILSYDYEHLIVGLNIIEKYILLGKNEFLNVYSLNLNQLFFSLIGDIQPKPLLLLLNIFDHLLILFPKETLKVFVKCFPKMLKDMFESKETIIISSYFSLFARVLYHDQNFFFSLFSDLNQVDSYIDFWIKNLDETLTSFNRKICCVSLLSLLPNPSFLKYFSSIFNFCISVLHEEDDIKELIQISIESEDKKLVVEKDLLLFQNLKHLLDDKLKKIESSIEQDNYKKLFNSIDPIIIEQYKKFK